MPESDSSEQKPRRLLELLLESSDINVEKQDVQAVIDLYQAHAASRKMLAAEELTKYEPLIVFRVPAGRRTAS